MVCPIGVTPGGAAVSAVALPGCSAFPARVDVDLVAHSMVVESVVNAETGRYVIPVTRRAAPRPDERPVVKKSLHSLTVLLLAAIAASAVAAPAVASDVASPDSAAPTVAPLDVSAIAIMPFDLPAEPWVSNVGFFFEPDGSRVAEYWSDMAIVDSNGATMLRKVVSEIRQMADPVSAQAEFQTWAGYAAEDGQIAATAPAVGDESVVATSSGENNRAEVVLRVGTVVARITLLDFTGGSPTPDQAVALGQIAAGRTATPRTPLPPHSFRPPVRSSRTTPTTPTSHQSRRPASPVRPRPCRTTSRAATAWSPPVTGCGHRSERSW